MSLIPLDESLTESSSAVQSFLLPPIQSKASFPVEYDYEETPATWKCIDESRPDRRPAWIRRYKSMHQSQHITGLLRDQWHGRRISYSRQ